MLYQIRNICNYVMFFKRFEWISCLNHSLSTKQRMRAISTDPNIVSCVNPDFRLESGDNTTIPELLKTNLHTWENDKAFDCAYTKRTYTHKEIFKKGESFATALIQCGLKRNDVVGIVLPNFPEFCIVYLGIWNAGLIASPANPNYLPDEITKQMIASEAKAIVTFSTMVETIKGVKKSCPKLKSIIVIGEPQQDCHSFFEMVKVNSKGTQFLAGSQISKDDIAVIPFSSGTTGPPKGVMLTHKNIVVNILQLSVPDFHNTHVNVGGDSQERLIGILPFYHIYGLTVIMGMTLYQGHFSTCFPKFDPKLFIGVMKRHKPTYIHVATPLVQFMVQRANMGKKETEHLKTIGCGGAPIGKELIRKCREKFGSQIFFQEGFGMTELSPISHLLRPSTGNTKIASIGSILPASQCKIIDINTGESLGTNGKGEMCVRGPQVMRGYYKNEKATKEAVDSEGWLHTGDIAYYDEDQCFYIVDRLKELIKVKGLQVAPAELEDILRQHPGVADVAVIGIPDERSGEAPRAFIIKTKNYSVSESDLRDYLNSRVAVHKRLKGGVEFIDAIPKSPTGKILHRKLKADFMKRSK